MRTHRVFDVIAPWSTGTPVDDPQRLAAVRIEPVVRQRHNALLLDFYLAGEHGDTVVPGVFVEPKLIVERERDPLLFPAGFRGGDGFATALAERILPHLDALMRSGMLFGEHVVAFAAAPRFEAARAIGAFGAAPLRDALVRLAPYHWARRYVRGREVLLDAPDAVGGWMVLRDLGTVGVAPGSRDAAAMAWYGEPPSSSAATVVVLGDGLAAPSSAETVLRLDAAGPGAVGVVDPLPVDVGFAYDAAEGPPRRSFVVERVAEPQRRAPLPPTGGVQGGSAGRIVIVLGRSDAANEPGADTDEAAALAAGLTAEGFEVAYGVHPDEVAGADLVHIIGVRDGRRVRGIVDAARRARIPSAIHAYEEDAAAGLWWGATVARLCFEYGADEASVERYLAMLARRAVSVGEATADAPYAPPQAELEESAAALRDAAIVFVASDEEAQRVLRRSGRRTTLAVVPPLVAIHEPAAVGQLVGPDPFAFVHAPIAPAANQLLVARSAAAAGIPLVLAGPVLDASYLERVREFGGRDLIVLPEPSAAQAAGLRMAAAVVVDAAWLGEGSARLAAAVLAGARLAVAERRSFAIPGIVPQRFDPGDLGALTRALGEAWDEGRRFPPVPPAEATGALMPAMVIRGIVRGYAEAAAGVT
ncbi:MAG TPA: hypothetical protein VMD91_01655 [Candidatus Sulfotelmatobacter sp.]|nr:hypothetical protein [Candidatus Sulfotelmatobacter sp.]